MSQVSLSSQTSFYSPETHLLHSSANIYSSIESHSTVAPHETSTPPTSHDAHHTTTSNSHSVPISSHQPTNLIQHPSSNINNAFSHAEEYYMAEEILGEERTTYFQESHKFHEKAHETSLHHHNEVSTSQRMLQQIITSTSHHPSHHPGTPLTPGSSSPNTVTLRTTLTPQDISPLQALHSSLFPVPYSSNFFQNLLRHPKIYTCIATVADETSPSKERVIGVCSCRVQEERFYDWANMLADAVFTILRFLCCCLGPIFFARATKKQHGGEHFESLGSVAARRHRRSGDSARYSPDSSPTTTTTHAPYSRNSPKLYSSTEYSYPIRTGYIMTLGVTKPNRRRGLASKMLKVIIKKMRESYQCHQLMLHCKTDNNVALEFYKRAFGFQIEKKIPNYYEIDNCLEDAYQLVMRIQGDESIYPEPRNVLATWLSTSLSYFSSANLDVTGKETSKVAWS